MSKISIDFGTTRTKVACLDPKSGEPRVIELGREIRSIIPSLFYIPQEGNILIGDDAVEASKLDPAGVIRGLKMTIERKPPIRKNKRKIDRIELASLLFAYIKKQCDELFFHDDPVTECVLTMPPTFFHAPSKLEAVRKAAELGGFELIDIVEEPVAAAKHWLKNGHPESPFIFVCDIGGGTSDFALLEKIPDSEDFKLYAELLPVGLEIGGNNIDDDIARDLDVEGIDLRDQDGFLLKIRQIKEFCSKAQDDSFQIVFHDQRIEIPREIILGACGEFTDHLILEVEKFLKRADRKNEINLEEVPLLLVGGGMNIPGLKESLKQVWPSEVIPWTDSEYATVCGAIVVGKADTGFKDAEKYFKKALACWHENLYNKSKWNDIPDTIRSIDEVIEICRESLKVVERFPPSFNLKNVLAREKNLLGEIGKAQKAWQRKEYDTVIQSCETAKKFYQNDDLPLPAVDYYDEDLITYTLILRAEAYFAQSKYEKTMELCGECIARKPDLRSAYFLRAISASNKKSHSSQKPSWSAAFDDLNASLKLKEDDFLVLLSVSSRNILKYKAFVLFNKKDFFECQEILQKLIQDFVNYSNLKILYLIVAAKVFIISGEPHKAISLVERLLKHELPPFIKKEPNFSDWIKSELSLMVDWGNMFSFAGNNDLVNTLLRWWVGCNDDLGDRNSVVLLYELSCKYTSTPYRYIGGGFIKHNYAFLITMAGVLIEKGEDDNAKNCLREMWRSFPGVSLEEVTKDAILKSIILTDFMPAVFGYIDKDTYNLYVTNKSSYALTDAEITIEIVYFDYFSSKIVRKKSVYKPYNRYRHNESILVSGNEFKVKCKNATAIHEKKGIKNLYSKLRNWKKKIKNIKISTKCNESKLVGREIEVLILK